MMRRFILQFPYCYFLIIYHSGSSSVCSYSSCIPDLYSMFNSFLVCSTFLLLSFHVADFVYSLVSMCCTLFYISLHFPFHYRLLLLLLRDRRCYCCCCYCWSCMYVVATSGSSFGKLVSHCCYLSANT